MKAHNQKASLANRSNRLQIALQYMQKGNSHPYALQRELDSNPKASKELLQAQDILEMRRKSNNVSKIDEQERKIANCLNDPVFRKLIALSRRLHHKFNNSPEPFESPPKELIKVNEAIDKIFNREMPKQEYYYLAKKLGVKLSREKR